MKKILSVATLLSVLFTLIGAGVGSAANRYASNSVPQLKTIVPQIAMSALGVGGFVFLQKKKGTAFQILKFAALAFGFQSVNTMLSDVGMKLSAKQQAAIDAGTAKPLTGQLLKALSAPTVSTTSLGNARVMLRSIGSGFEEQPRRVTFAS